MFVGSGSIDEQGEFGAVRLRPENEHGCAYMMEKMAFKSTEQTSREAMVKYSRCWCE